MGLGAINGIFVAYVGIASFVATLGMLFTLDGLALVISHSTPVQVPGTKIGSVTSFAQIFGGGTYSELFWAIGFVIILQLVLTFSRWGLYTVSTGGNRLGAAEAGIRTRMIIVRNFVLCAGMAGFDPGQPHPQAARPHRALPPADEPRRRACGVHRL